MSKDAKRVKRGFDGPCVVISRWRAARSRFATGPGAAWNYRYDLRGPDGSELASGLERLSIARRMARERAVSLGARVVEAWS